MTEPSETDICETCGNPREPHPFRHPFNEGQAGATAFLGVKKPKPGHPTGDNGNGAQNRPQTAPWPLDPVLRTALINKGVITPQDLRDAEEVIRATTQQFQDVTQGSRHGKSAEEARGR